MALKQISPDAIDPNPDNPRLVFREQEMNQLLDSIREVGIKVPLSVYPEGDRYVLIDGERRWRCSRRLNLKLVPALVEPKPTRLQNILTMFNIHNVRVDWDLMPMALKLDQVRKLLEKDGMPSRAKNLSAITGVPLSTIRRALELLELPMKYQTMLLQEAEKPRDQQKVTADLFVEINKSKRAIERYVPQVFEEIPEDEYVESMVEKYRSGVIKNVVHFRDVSRMARAERAGEDPEEVIPTLVDFVRRPDVSVEDAYRETVAAAYQARDLTTRVTSLIDLLRGGPQLVRVPRELKALLDDLRSEINRILGE